MLAWWWIRRGHSRNFGYEVISVSVATSDGEKLEFTTEKTEEEFVAELNNMDILTIKFPLWSGNTYVSKLHITSVFIEAAK